MQQTRSLTRITCAGIVDADARDDNNKAHLRKLGISVLPVSEIENIFLLPDVSRAIGQTEDYDEHELEDKLQKLKQKVFDSARESRKIKEAVARFCRRRIDQHLKKLDLSRESSVEEITNEFNKKVAELDISVIASYAENKIKSSIENDDLASLLEIYDDKSLISSATACLKQKRKQDFENWIARIFRKQTTSNLVKAIQQVLPTVEAA